MRAFFRKEQAVRETVSPEFSEDVPYIPEYTTVNDSWMNRLCKKPVARGFDSMPQGEPREAAPLLSLVSGKNTTSLRPQKTVVRLREAHAQLDEEFVRERDISLAKSICRKFEALCILMQLEADEWELQAISTSFKNAMRAGSKAKLAVNAVEHTEPSHKGLFD